MTKRLEEEIGNLTRVVEVVRQDQMKLKEQVDELEAEKEMLRQGIRKLKVENLRMKEKVKILQNEVGKLGSEVFEDDGEPWNREYDELGRNEFILVGGKMDPFATKHEAAIKDENGIEHKSSERYIWYKMAEKFGDKTAMKIVLEEPNINAAEEAVKAIKGFDENVWAEIKLEVWKDSQRLKFEQIRSIQNLLVETGDQYIAVADQDKQIGTGWRKNRDEANKPIFWDGDNEGGIFLMRYRQELAGSHKWAGPYEHEETQKKYNELKRFVWRRIDMKLSHQNYAPTGGYIRRGYAMRGGNRGNRGGRGTRGGYRGRGPNSYANH